MSASPRWMILLLAAGCPRPLPSALSLPDDPAEAALGAEADLTSRAEALRYVLAGDPLARRPKLPSDAVLDAVPGGDALLRAATEIRQLEGPGRDLTGGLKVLSTRYPGTETTGITRGYRLGLAERLIATHQGSDADELHDLAPLLSELTRDPQAALRTRNALEVLVGEHAFPEAVRRYGSRWVLQGWLDGPDVPLEPVAAALRQPAYDKLRESRTGQLVLARAEARVGDPAPGLEDLRRATELALHQASSDRHREQGTWSDARRQAAEELGTEDPIPFLLKRGAATLTDAAAAPEAVGGALVALTALRLLDACDWEPCGGLDRTASLSQAMRWSPELEPYVRAWRVVALKNALDMMEVGHDSVLFRRALTDLLDALLGTGATPVNAGVLTRDTAEPEVWALLGSSVGAPTAGSWDAARVALGRHLANEARIAGEHAEESWTPWLDRIERRAIP